MLNEKENYSYGIIPTDKASKKMDVLSKYIPFSKNKFKQFKKLFKDQFDKTLILKEKSKEIKYPIGVIDNTKSIESILSTINIRMKLVAKTIQTIYLDIKENVLVEIFDTIRLIDSVITNLPQNKTDFPISGFIYESNKLQPTKQYYLKRRREININYQGSYNESLLHQQINTSFYTKLGSGLQSERLKVDLFDNSIKSLISYHIGADNELLLGHELTKCDLYINNDYSISIKGVSYDGVYNYGTNAGFILRIDTTGVKVRKLTFDNPIELNDSYGSQYKPIKESYFLNTGENYSTLVSNGIIIELFNSTLLSDIFSKDLIHKNNGWKLLQVNSDLELSCFYKKINDDGYLEIRKITMNVNIDNLSSSLKSDDLIEKFGHETITNVPVIKGENFEISNYVDGIYTPTIVPIYYTEGGSLVDYIIGIPEYKNLLEYTNITFKHENNKLYIDGVEVNIPEITIPYTPGMITINNHFNNAPFDEITGIGYMDNSDYFFMEEHDLFGNFVRYWSMRTNLKFYKLLYNNTSTFNSYNNVFYFDGGYTLNHFKGKDGSGNYGTSGNITNTNTYNVRTIVGMQVNYNYTHLINYIKVNSEEVLKDVLLSQDEYIFQDIIISGNDLINMNVDKINCIGIFSNVPYGIYTKHFENVSDTMRISNS